MLHKRVVSIENERPYPCYIHSSGATWNGWERPLFTEATFDAFYADQKADGAEADFLEELAEMRTFRRDGLIDVTGFIWTEHDSTTEVLKEYVADQVAKPLHKRAAGFSLTKMVEKIEQLENEAQ